MFANMLTTVIHLRLGLLDGGDRLARALDRRLTAADDRPEGGPGDVQPAPAG